LLQLADDVDGDVRAFREKFLCRAALRAQPAELVADGVHGGHGNPKGWRRAQGWLECRCELMTCEESSEMQEPGEAFRNAWIAGVQRHYPGEPKQSYVAPWSETAEWERAAAAAVYGQVQAFVEVSGGQTVNLSREQKGRFVALCWIAQVFKHISDPKPAYVADWDGLPKWQQETDVDIFELIERTTLATGAQ
jgi:hypothetical protein